MTESGLLEACTHPLGVFKQQGEEKEEEERKEVMKEKKLP